MESLLGFEPSSSGDSAAAAEREGWVEGTDKQVANKKTAGVDGWGEAESDFSDVGGGGDERDKSPEEAVV